MRAALVCRALSRRVAASTTVVPAMIRTPLALSTPVLRWAAQSAASKEKKSSKKSMKTEPMEEEEEEEVLVEDSDVPGPSTILIGLPPPSPGLLLPLILSSKYYLQ